MWKEIENKYGVKKGLYALVLKRVIDFLFTLVGFVVISPLFLVLCVLVRCQLGSPIFFKQKRTGKDEKTFEMIKFRTMTDARDLDGNLLPDTERFTKFGDFMRRSSLDELPELLNVLFIVLFTIIIFVINVVPKTTRIVSKNNIYFFIFLPP